MRTRIWKHASRRVGIGFAGVALLLTTASCLCGQNKSSAEGQATASVQPVQRDYRFEVASIRPVGPPTGLEYKTGPTGPQYTPGRFRENNVSFAVLAMMAFAVKHSYQIEYPRWMATTYFTVNATLPEGATKPDLPIMFQHLLEDRFGLVFHHETRQMAGYELVVAKSGSKLTKSATPAPDQSTVKGPTIEVKNGLPQFSKDAGSGELWSGGYVQWRGRDEMMEKVAARLTDRLGAPVMDATGLEGEYDFTLFYTPEATSSQGNGVILSPPPPSTSANPSAGGDGASAPLEHPLLQDALQEQLGLKLQPVKNVPVDIVVVDSAKKEPTEN
jgi:uncharacterized protein (TIGR03435 family)